MAGENLNLKCPTCGESIDIITTKQEGKFGEKITYTKHCTNCDRENKMNSNNEIICPACGGKLEPIEKYPFGFGIVQKCKSPECKKEFYKTNNSGKTMLRRAGI
ncbi:hypothetical protein K0B03_02655 [Patescibacteria group bacterium]|nr:hypothetical protein [Patescibacteria group bacterium]